MTNRVPAAGMVHALRHTYATRLAKAGADAMEIQVLGQESLNTSQGYIEATANRTRQAARANRTYRTLEELARPKAATSAKRGSRARPQAAPLPSVAE